MHTDDTKKVTQIASLVDRLSRTSENLNRSNAQATDALQRTTQAVPGLLQEAARQTLSSLATDVAQAVRKGLNEPLAGLNREVGDNINRINGVTHGLAQSQQQIAAVTRKLIWLMAGVFATVLLVIVAGGGLLWHYRSVMAENQIEADLMRAYNQADVTLCEGQLCVRVDRAGKRYGDYVPVKPR